MINVDKWSSNKTQARSTSSEAKVESFSVHSKICRKRALLETERRFFNNKIEETFAVSNAEIAMKLTDREKATLLLCPRIFSNKQELDDRSKWNDCKEELKHCFRACCVQNKAFTGKTMTVTKM